MNVPSDLTSDLADERSALGQESLPPRDLDGGSARGDLVAGVEADDEAYNCISILRILNILV